MATAQIENSQGFRSCVHSILAREKRSAAIELWLGGIVYVALAVVFFAVTVYLVAFFSVLFIFPLLDLIGIKPFKTAALFVLAFSGLGWRRIFSSEFNRIIRYGPFEPQNYFEATVEIFIELLLSGPRCAVLAVRDFIGFVRLLRLDLFRLIDPIELAFRRHRKTRQMDLGELDLENFLRDIAWFKEVIHLHAPPRGFVLSEELRRELRQWNRLRANETPEEETEPEPEAEPVGELDDELTERMWALGVLGLSGNPSAAEIKRAYRTLAKRHHPDVRRQVDAETRMKDLNRAMEILKRAT